MKAASSVLAANINSKYWLFKKKRSSDFPRWQCTKSTLHNFYWPFCLKTCNNFIYWFPSVCSRDPLIPLHAMVNKKKKSLCQHMKVAGENVTVPDVYKAFFFGTRKSHRWRQWASEVSQTSERQLYEGTDTFMCTSTKTVVKLQLLC